MGKWQHLSGPLERWSDVHRGYVALCADTDGRGYNVAVPGNPVVGNTLKRLGTYWKQKEVVLMCLTCAVSTLIRKANNG